MRSASDVWDASVAVVCVAEVLLLELVLEVRKEGGCSRFTTGATLANGVVVVRMDERNVVVCCCKTLCVTILVVPRTGAAFWMGLAGI